MHPFLIGLLGLAALLLAPRAYTALRYGPHLRTPAEAPAAPVAVVFGAGLWRSGQPSAVLYDRVAAGVELYRQGKVERLLLTGDGRNPAHSETEAMRQLAMELGAPEAALLLDPQGLSTFESCSRARQVYGLTHALLVTQSFHLPRALLLCEGLGIRAEGVSADRRSYHPRSLAYWNLRELFATANAVWQVAAPGLSGAGRASLPQ